MFTPSYSGQDGGSLASEDRGYIYPVTYFPNSLSYSDAETVNVYRSSEERLDVRPPEVREVVINGHLAQKPENASFRVSEHADSIDIPINVPVKFKSADGSFTISDIASGTYKIDASWNEDGKERYASQLVDSETNASDLSLTEDQLVTVHGTVNHLDSMIDTAPVDGGSQKEAVSLLMKCKYFVSSSDYNVDITAKTEYTIPSVRPGRCALSLKENSGMYIQSVRRDGVQLSVDDFDVTDNNARYDLDIELGSSYGTISGNVDRAEEDVEQMGVVMRSLESGRYLVVKTTATGAFRISEVPVGDYDLYGWEDIDRAAYRSKGYLQRYGRHNASITVNANQETRAVIEANSN